MKSGSKNVWDTEGRSDCVNSCAGPATENATPLPAGHPRQVADVFCSSTWVCVPAEVATLTVEDMSEPGYVTVYRRRRIPQTGWS